MTAFRRRRRGRSALPAAALVVAFAAPIAAFAQTPAPAPQAPAQPQSQPAPQAPPAGQTTPGTTPGTTSAAPPVAATGTAPATDVTLPQPLTLQSAIEAALRLQPDIFVAQADRESAIQQLRQANARFLPTVAPQFTYIRNYTFVNVNRFTTVGNGTGTGTGGAGTGTGTGTGGTGTGTGTGGTGTGVGTNGRQVSGGDLVALPRSSTNETRQGDVSLRYLLYDSGQRQANASAARANLRATEFGEQNTRQGVIGNVADNYFNVLRTDALVRVSQAQITRAQNTLEVIQAQVDVGQAPPKDILQARADLENARVQLLLARNNADIAQAQFKNSIGIVGGGRLALADVAAPTDTTPTTATLTPAAATTGAGQQQPTTPTTSTAPAETGADAALNDFIGLAYTARADISGNAAGIEVNRAQVRLARINSGVQVTSDTALGFQFSPNTGNNREITAQISYPLFDAGLSRSQVRAAEASQRAAELRLESLRQQVAVEVEQAYRQLALSRASVPAAQIAQQAAQLNFEAASEARREGVGTIVDVITAQTLLVQAQTNFVQAVYDFYAADARLARSVGQAERLLTNGVAPAPAGQGVGAAVGTGAAAAPAAVTPAAAPVVAPPTPSR